MLRTETTDPVLTSQGKAHDRARNTGSLSTQHQTCNITLHYISLLYITFSHLSDDLTASTYILHRETCFFPLQSSIYAARYVLKQLRVTAFLKGTTEADTDYIASRKWTVSARFLGRCQKRVDERERLSFAFDYLTQNQMQADKTLCLSVSLSPNFTSNSLL